jgi:hypothetical protein
MVSDATFADVQTSLARLNLMPAITQALANYGLTLPAHDPSTGLIASADVEQLLAAASGVDASAQRASHSADIFLMLQSAGLAA